MDQDNRGLLDKKTKVKIYLAGAGVLLCVILLVIVRHQIRKYNERKRRAIRKKLREAGQRYIKSQQLTEKIVIPSQQVTGKIVIPKTKSSKETKHSNTQYSGEQYSGRQYSKEKQTIPNQKTKCSDTQYSEIEESLTLSEDTDSPRFDIAESLDEAKIYSEPQVVIPISLNQFDIFSMLNMQPKRESGVTITELD